MPSLKRPRVNGRHVASTDSGPPVSVQRRIGGAPGPELGAAAAIEHAALSLADRLQRANREFSARVDSGVDVPINVLIEQRDSALRELTETQQRSQQAQQRLVAGHERYIGFLMEEQLAVLSHLRKQLSAREEDLRRLGEHSPTPLTVAATELGESAPSVNPSELEELQARLAAAFAEVDEARLVAARLQEELDEAIRASDDVRHELQADLDAARDETFELQRKLDATLTALDDARDAGRDEAVRLNEELDEVQRQLDERTNEMRRAREHLAAMSEAFGAAESRRPDLSRN